MASDKPVKTYQRGVASNEIYGVLRDEILALKLEPAASLDETSLSKRFAVSRSPIREALNRQLAERLVETLPNRSTIVAQIDLRNFGAFIQALDVQQRSAMRLAAENRTDADLAKLRGLASAFNDTIVKAAPLDIMQANFAFHIAVSEAGKMKWSGQAGQRAKMYPTLKTGYTNDEETQFFRQVQSYGGA